MQTCKVASQRHASFPSTGTPSLLPGRSLRQILTLESSLQEASLSPGKDTIDKLIKVVITIIIFLEFSSTNTCGIPSQVPDCVGMGRKGRHCHPVVIVFPS